MSWHVGDRSQDNGIVFLGDLEARLANRVQLITDGHKAYLKAVSAVDFNAEYAMLNKIFATDYAVLAAIALPSALARSRKPSWATPIRSVTAPHLLSGRT